MDVKGFDKPSVFQNDASRFCEWNKKIEDSLIGVEPQLVILDCSLEKEPEIRQSVVAVPTEEINGYAQISAAQNCSGTFHRRR